MWQRQDLLEGVDVAEELHRIKAAGLRPWGGEATERSLR